MVENTILKRNARAQLGNEIFKEKWLMMLLACAIPSLIISAAGNLFGGFAITSSITNAIINGDMETFFTSMGTSSLLSSVVTIVLTGPLTYGLVKVLLAQVESEKWSLANLFDGFKECFTKSFLLGLLQSLFIFLWSMLFFIPGIVKSYSYALAFYIQRDDNTKESVDCITESRRMMDGHKWQLFCLDLSFLGWYIVGALCFGIGVYFVTPYHEMARANFYEALKAENMPQVSTEAV